MTQNKIKVLELEALIEDLRLNHEYCPKEVILQAADELERLSQRTEQEPVAWGVFEGNLHDMFFTREDAENMADLKGTPAEVRPLYTTPPQRTWVGLTDDEIWEAYMKAPLALDCSTDELYAISRTVEAKLKEKNND
jgi:hypothetical protein